MGFPDKRGLQIYIKFPHYIPIRQIRTCLCYTHIVKMCEGELWVGADGELGPVGQLQRHQLCVRMLRPTWINELVMLFEISTKLLAKMCFFRVTFWILKPGKWSLSRYIYPENLHFPDYKTRKVKTFRVLISGMWSTNYFFMSLSGYCYLESFHFPCS